MLIRDDGDTWTAITQPAHAHLSGQVAAQWATPLAPEVVLGVEQHDVPWVEQDRMPPLYPPARRAASFIELDMDTRWRIWSTVTERLVAQSPYAALLLSLHSTNIHTRYVPAEHRPDGLLDRARDDQDALLAVLPDATREQAERDAEIVFGLDALSLMLCHGWDAQDLPPIYGVTIHVEPVGEGEATLDPWPLRLPELEVSVATRTLSERFDDEAEMQAALAATPNARESWRLRPGG